MQGINSISSFIILFESVFSLVSQRSSNRELIHSTLPFVCHFLHNFNKSANVRSNSSIENIRKSHSHFLKTIHRIKHRHTNDSSQSKKNHKDCHGLVVDVSLALCTLCRHGSSRNIPRFFSSELRKTI